MDLKDRVALVAGGTGVLGTAIVRALAGAGAHVAITYLERHEAARETCAAVEALGRRAWSVTLDQTDAEAIPAAVEAAAKHFGRLDALVNNAGWNISIPFPDLETLDAAVWDRLFSTNLRGPYLLARAAAARLKASGAGRIVNIASVAGLQGAQPEALRAIAYQTTKGGVVNFTRALAAEWGRHRIVVNAICPGFIVTEMSRVTLEKIAPLVKATTPLRQLGEEQDMQGLVVMLSSAAVRHITGQIIAVDGGTSIV